MAGFRSETPTHRGAESVSGSTQFSAAPGLPEACQPTGLGAVESFAAGQGVCRCPVDPLYDRVACVCPARGRDHVSELPFPELTRRQRQVALLLVDGVRPRFIAERLGMALATVNTHRENILRELGLLRLRMDGNVALARLAIRRGYIAP